MLFVCQGTPEFSGNKNLAILNIDSFYPTTRGPNFCDTRGQFVTNNSSSSGVKVHT
jgi:hypothetical protein